MQKIIAIFITVWATWLVAVVIGVLANPILHVALRPWYAFCQLITPVSWLIGGEIFMGLLWAVSGVIAYGLLLSLIPVTLIMVRHTWEASSMSKEMV